MLKKSHSGRALLCLFLTSLIVPILFWMLAKTADPSVDQWFIADPVNNALQPSMSSSWMGWGDVNGDGYADLWSGNHGVPRLFINHGGRLVDETKTYGVGGRRDSHGAVWADYDNDGRQDFIELVGAARGLGKGGGPRLHRNLGGRFEEVAARVGLALPLMRGRAPLWFDFDGDNQLDVLLTAAARESNGPGIYRQSGGVFSSGKDPFSLAGVANSDYAQLAYTAPGKLALLLKQHIYPAAVFEPGAGQLVAANNPLPAKVGAVTDSIWADFNNDQVDDLLLVRDRSRSAVRQTDERRLEVLLDKPPNELTRQFEFLGPAAISLSIYPRAKVWWNQKVVMLGERTLNENDLQQGRLPKGGLHFRADKQSAAAVPDTAVLPERYIRVSYESESGRWRIVMHSARHEDANIIITAQEPLSVAADWSKNQSKPKPKPKRLRPRLFLSSPQGYQRQQLPDVRRPCTGGASGDFDNDGDLDLVLVCGSVLDNKADVLLQNLGAGEFAIEPRHPFKLIEGVPDAAAVADYNRDGVLDLVISNGGGKGPLGDGPLQFFTGVDRGNNWLQVDLTPPVGKAYPFGAQLLLHAGGTVQARTISGGIHKGAQDDLIQHFGLGQIRMIEALELRWPDGRSRSLTRSAANARMRFSTVEINSRVRLPAYFYD